MADIHQPSLFSWQAVDSSPSIERFLLVLEAIDDEALMRYLEDRRKGRRNDYPIRAMWNSLLAGLIFGHESINALRDELNRNAELRQACGFEPGRRFVQVNGTLRVAQEAPSKDAYSRFLKSLRETHEMVDAIFLSLVRRLGELLPDFGQRLAADGKAIKAVHKGDVDAAVGAKRQGHPDGDEGAEVTTWWFGYKLHMVSDAKYELPVAFKVTNAAEHESPHFIDLIETAKQRTPEVLDRTETLVADKGYDDGADKATLYQDYAIKPLIPARDLHNGEMKPLDPSKHDTIYISPTGQIMCRVAPFEKDRDKQFAAMQFHGFEKNRGTLKFRCPAAAFGIECANRRSCAQSCNSLRNDYGRVVRVPLHRESRLLGPIYPHSYRFADLYKQRTSIERLFSRLDHMYGMERHHTVGLKRMQLRVTLALTAMLATAVGWIEAGQAEHLRKRLRPAA